MILNIMYDLDDLICRKLIGNDAFDLINLVGGSRGNELCFPRKVVTESLIVAYDIVMYLMVLMTEYYKYFYIYNAAHLTHSSEVSRVAIWALKTHHKHNIIFHLFYLWQVKAHKSKHKENPPYGIQNRYCRKFY